MNTRNGKIARLPKAIRDELNQRLQDGIEGKSLVEWLNGLPEVQSLVQTQFDGYPIREQNLSQWKKGGYRDWVHLQQALELARHLYEGTDELSAVQKDPRRLSEVLALWTASRYTVSTREIADTKGREGWQRLREMCTDVIKLRRIDQHAERLELQRGRLALQEKQFEFTREQATKKEAREDWAAWSDEKRIAWAREPENFDRIRPADNLTSEERSRRVRAILGL
ncbi:MAG: hypothetical protein P4L99_20665 [Chthoniobacter sp.]|nr:hypothetical protein [Chthoniobacter sp.]